jgi:glycosyltransferase involved in cell wall biosynthesis
MRTLGVPIVTSPIFFTRHSAAAIRTSLAFEHTLKRLRPGIWTDYGYTEAICRWAAAVLPNTIDEGSLVQRGLSIPAWKITVVPNGVDPRFESADPSLFTKTYGLKNFILNVGHIGPARKNVMSLIRALSAIDHPAVIIGRVTEGRFGEACLKEAAKNKNILIIPGLENESEMLASAYAACDTFVLPSMFETPGIAALEAALAGAKIVITPHGGTKDYFGTMAEYVDPYSVASIGSGIRKALNASRSSTLKEHVKKEFLWSAVARKTLEVYKRVLGDRTINA